MGRYLANGIAAEIKIVRKKKEYSRVCEDLLEIKDEITASLSEMIDLDMYDIQMSSNRISFSLKKEIFNDNIHDFVRKMNSITRCNSLLYYFRRTYYKKSSPMCAEAHCICHEEVDVNKGFSKKKQLIELRIHKKGNYSIDKGETYLQCNEEEVELDDSPWYYEWSMSRNKEINSCIEICIKFVRLWTDCDKYDGEDDYFIPYLLNYYSRGHIKDNPLSNCLLFYIFG